MYFHVSVDMVPRLTNVPSQYQLQDMYEFSALQNSNALAKIQQQSKVVKGNGDGGGNAADESSMDYYQY